MLNLHMSILKEIAVFQIGFACPAIIPALQMMPYFKIPFGFVLPACAVLMCTKRQHLKVLVAMRLGAKISASDALLAGEHGLVHCLIFGPEADPFLRDVTPGAFEIISHSGCTFVTYWRVNFSDFSSD